MTETRFNIDWDIWHSEWKDWVAKHHQDLKRSTYQRWPRQANFLADSILARWNVNGREVELSAVTMPDLGSNSYRDSIRFVGITWGESNGTLPTTAGTLCETWAELDTELGFTS